MNNCFIVVAMLIVSIRPNHETERSHSVVFVLLPNKGHMPSIARYMEISTAPIKDAVLISSTTGE